MRIAVVGVGGLGGYLGGRLANAFPPGAKHEVLFVEKNRTHLDAIQKHGLRLSAKDGNAVAKPSLATDDVGKLGRVDVALMCTKGYDLVAAAKMVAPAIGAETVVIPPGNGVGNADLVKEGLGGRGVVLSACIYISTHIVGPGVVEQMAGPRKFFFGNPDGRTEPYRPIAAAFKEGGLNVELTASILREVWSKYLFVEPLSALTSLYGVPQGGLLTVSARRVQVTEMMNELLALAKRVGVALSDDIVAQSMAKADSFPYETKTSMQLDFEQGKPTEVETMIGYAVRKGRELRVSMPQHDEVYAALSRKAK